MRLCNLIDQANLGLEALPELTVKVSELIYLIPDVAVVPVSEIEDPYPTKPEDRFSDTPENTWSNEAPRRAEARRQCGSLGPTEGRVFSSIFLSACGQFVDPEDKRCWEYHAGNRPKQTASAP